MYPGGPQFEPHTALGPELQNQLLSGVRQKHKDEGPAGWLTVGNGQHGSEAHMPS